jgi:hypothetical protein
MQQYWILRASLRSTRDYTPGDMSLETKTIPRLREVGCANTHLCRIVMQYNWSIPMHPCLSLHAASRLRIAWPPRLRALAAIAGLVVAIAAGPAAADRDASDAARVDWAAGWVIAGGTGIADRHAPSPAVALGTSRRGAEDAARARIAAKLGSLPLAAGGTLADRLGDPAVRARIDAAVAAAIALAAEPETDGSWHVTLAVPIEAIRIAMSAEGPRALDPAGDRGPPVVVVEGVAARPAVGWTVAGAAVATLWASAAPAWAKDAPRVVARSARAGAIDAPAKGTPATLYVIVARP